MPQSFQKDPPYSLTPSPLLSAWMFLFKKSLCCLKGLTTYWPCLSRLVGTVSEGRGSCSEGDQNSAYMIYSKHTESSHIHRKEDAVSEQESGK